MWSIAFPTPHLAHSHSGQNMCWGVSSSSHRGVLWATLTPLGKRLYFIQCGLAMWLSLRNKYVRCTKKHPCSVSACAFAAWLNILSGWVWGISAHACCSRAFCEPLKSSNFLMLSSWDWCHWSAAETWRSNWREGPARLHAHLLGSRSWKSANDDAGSAGKVVFRGSLLVGPYFKKW